MVRLAINGYGRIGRIAHRVILERHPHEVEVVAINTSSSTDIKGWMYLLKYDTVYGPLVHNLKCQNSNVKSAIGEFVINGGEPIPVFSQKDPALLPWKDLNVDVVIESTGVFRKEQDLKKHLDAGAKTVLLSAPAKDGDVLTQIISVNQESYKGEKLVNSASCTTNCITPIAKVMGEHFGIEKAMMTTVHAYTSDQRLQDGGHKDYRRARAAVQNIVPTSTGATEAVAAAMPSLENKFTGLAIRVPVITGSLSDFTFLLKKDTTVEEINNVFKQEAGSTIYKGILAVTEDPIVSSDIIGNPHSAIVDLSLTQVVGGNMAKVIAWYDNEYGYCCRLVEEAILVGKNSS